MQDRDAQHARGMQEASGRVVHDLEVKIKQLQSQLEQSQQALHAVKAQYGQQETLVQTQQHMDKLQCDLASERQKVTKLSSKSQEVAQAKQDVLLATKALQVRQLQVCQFPDMSTQHARHTMRKDQMEQQQDTYHLSTPWPRIIQQQGPAFLSAAMPLQAKEKQIGRLQLKLQRQQSAIEEIEALKVCLDLDLDPQGVSPIPCRPHVL